jgi:hypothetical protein
MDRIYLLQDSTMRAAGHLEPYHCIIHILGPKSEHGSWTIWLFFTWAILLEF